MELTWPQFAGFIVFLLGTLVIMARLAVHTQARLARQKERDGVIDALVWINRQLTGRPEHHPLTGK